MNIVGVSDAVHGLLDKFHLYGYILAFGKKKIIYLCFELKVFCKIFIQIYIQLHIISYQDKMSYRIILELISFC